MELYKASCFIRSLVSSRQQILFRKVLLALTIKFRASDSGTTVPHSPCFSLGDAQAFILQIGGRWWEWMTVLCASGGTFFSCATGSMQVPYQFHCSQLVAGGLVCLVAKASPVSHLLFVTPAMHPHKASTHPPGTFAASHFLGGGRRYSCPSPCPGLHPSSISPDQLHSCFRLQGKVSLVRVLLSLHWNIFELAEQLCGGPHFPVYKAFSLTSLCLRDKVWLVSQWVPVRREATAKAGLLLSWHEFWWGGDGPQPMCSSQHPVHGDSLFPPYFAIGGAAAWLLHVTHKRLLSTGAGRPASSTAESCVNKGH